MGRKSIQSKKQKRFRQKSKKKASHCKHDASSTDSFGSPSSPPNTPSFTLSLNSSPVRSNTTPSTTSFAHHTASLQNKSSLDLFGLDEDIFTYEEDAKHNFELHDGKSLDGEELIKYLKDKNKQLLFKAKKFKDKLDSLQLKSMQLQVENEEKIRRIRTFYKNMFLYSSSRSSRMIKAALLND